MTKQIRRPAHYGDVGEPLTESHYQPRTIRKNPEEDLSVLFALLGRDYHGPFPAHDRRTEHAETFPATSAPISRTNRAPAAAGTQK